MRQARALSPNDLIVCVIRENPRGKHRGLKTYLYILSYYKRRRPGTDAPGRGYYLLSRWDVRIRVLFCKLRRRAGYVAN